MWQGCGGCLAGPASLCGRLRQRKVQACDHTPDRGRGAAWPGRAGKVAVDSDLVPTHERPRVGSWASPAPNSPNGWGTWVREVTESEPPSAGRGPVQFGLSIEEGAAPRPVRAQSIDDGDTIEDRRRRLREICMAARRLDSPVVPVGEAVKAPGSGGGRDFRTEQLFSSPGSLPTYPSRVERERVQRDLLSRILRDLPWEVPMCERIAKVPRRLLTARGPDGQNFRRQLLRGATVVFFTAGYEGKRFIFERAHALGVKSVLIESPDSWSQRLVAEGIVAKFIPVDMSQSSDLVYKESLKAIEDLANDRKCGPPDGICTFVELSVPTAARLAEALGLPGPLPESVDKARDKYRTRAALADAGMPTPPNYLITSAADLPTAAKHVGFPAVLKPVSGAASLGVKKVVSEQDLRNTYFELDAELRSLVVSSGALVQKSDNTSGTQAVGVIGASFLLERYLDGAEVDVDIVMSEGEWQYAAVSDNGPTLEPYFNETWAVSPSLLPRQQQVELKELAIGSVKALGFLDGVFHVECKYTSLGPQLIEVNARMGGGPVYETNLRCWNVCLVEETLFVALGVPSRPDVPKQPKECIANSDVNALRSGTLADDSFLEPLRNREGVISFSPHVGAGAKVVGPDDGLPTWLVEVVVTRPTPREALDYLLALEAEVQQKVRLV